MTTIDKSETEFSSLYGSGPFQAPPTGPATNQSYNAFHIKQSAHLNKNLKTYSESATTTKDLDMSGARTNALHAMLYDEIVKGMNDLSEYCFTTLILTFYLTFILAMLPEDFNNIINVIIDKDGLPSPKDLIDKVKNAMRFHPTPPTASAYNIYAKGGNCLNYNSPSHYSAGHLTKYCFFGSHDAIPDYLSPLRNAEIMAKRQKTKDKNKTNENTKDKMLAIKDKTMLTIVKGARQGRGARQGQGARLHEQTGRKRQHLGHRLNK